MDMDRARLSVRFLLKRLQSQTDALERQQFPGNHQGPRKWIALMQGLLDTARSLLDESLEQSPQQALSSVQDAAHLGAMTYNCIAFLSGADSNQLPYSIVSPLQRWFDALDLRYETLFRAELVANYEVRPFLSRTFKRIRNPSNTLKEAIDNIHWPLLRITVPSGAFVILPHLAIVAHEIGHNLYHQMIWDEAEVKQPFAEEEGHLFERIASRLGVKTLSAETKSIYKEIFDRWFEELVADAFAFFLTGPAMFFALSDFLQLLDNSYGMSTTHPANDLRRQILFQKLCEAPPGEKSFADVFKNSIGVELLEDFNSALMRGTPDSTTVFEDMQQHGNEAAAVMAELHQSMKLIDSVIYEIVRKYLSQRAPSTLYTPNQFEFDLEEHLDAVLDAIPPIESGEGLDQKAPAKFATILNVGWVTMLTRLDGLKILSDGDADKLEKFHGLLLKGVELSEIRREWEQV